MQLGLDVAGCVPLIGEAADGANALISLGRGDYTGAALSAASMIPVVGDAIGKGGKAARYAAKYADEAAEAAKKLSKTELPVVNPEFTPKPTTLGRIGEALAETTGVKKLSYTQQLRDYVDYAKQMGYRFELWVRPDTELSGPLLEAIHNGEIILRHIDGI